MLNAKLKPIETDEERGADRYRLLLPASIETAEADAGDAIIRDLSSGGFLIECGTQLAVGAEVTLEIPGAGVAVGDIIWASGSFSGGEFRKPLTLAELAAARSSSAVVWPDFVPRSAADRDAPAGETPLVHQVRVEDSRLPLAHRFQIIVGASVLLWVPIFFGIWSLVG